MISRRTIFSLLLTLLLAAGIRLWAAYQRDDCDRLGPVKNAQVMVQSGSRTITVPCTYWVPRQPLWVDALLLLNCVLALVFVTGVVSDWARHRARMRAGIDPFYLR